jgi:hypothetical protein
MTCDSNAVAPPLNPPIPVLLRPDEYERCIIPLTEFAEAEGGKGLEDADLV